MRSCLRRGLQHHDATAAIAATAACLLFLLFASDPSGERESGIAQLSPHGSIVTIFSADGKPRSIQTADQPLALRLNEAVETSQAIDTAEIALVARQKWVGCSFLWLPEKTP